MTTKATSPAAGWPIIAIRKAPKIRVVCSTKTRPYGRAMSTLGGVWRSSPRCRTLPKNESPWLSTKPSAGSTNPPTRKRLAIGRPPAKKPKGPSRKGSAVEPSTAPNGPLGPKSVTKKKPCADQKAP